MENKRTDYAKKCITDLRNETASLKILPLRYRFYSTDTDNLPNSSNPLPITSNAVESRFVPTAIQIRYTVVLQCAHKHSFPPVGVYLAKHHCWVCC
jgi:hypothetical protein